MARASAASRATAADPCSAGFLRDLVRGMRCGVLSVDREGRLILLNEPGRRILELEPEPDPGIPFATALAGHPQLVQVLRECFTMSNLPNRAELDLRCGPAGTRRVGFTLSMIADEGGVPYGAAVFFKDLTPVERKEEQDRLKDRLAALGQMAANLAHEIRNPLASIKVSCSLLGRRLGDAPEEAELLEKILTEVKRLNRMITSSLDFVRPLLPSPAPTDLHALIRESLEAARTRWPEPRIRVRTAFDPSVPPVLIDPGQIRQVFENLFVNALEAMGKSGALAVETTIVPAPGAASVPYSPAGGETDPWHSFESYVQVRVADTGPGIGAQHRDRLFYPFFTTKRQGSGVGLSLAKKIISSHRGLLDVESRPGEGATFVVRLPLVTTGTAEG